jgi:hypothetical protein
MAFKINKSLLAAEQANATEKTTKIKVELAEFDESGRKLSDKGHFYIECVMLDTESMNRLTKEEGFNNFEMAETYLRGWSDIKDEEGNDIPYNDENRSLVLSDPGLAMAIGEAIVNANFRKRVTTARKPGQRR